MLRESNDRQAAPVLIKDRRTFITRVVSKIRGFHDANLGQGFRILGIQINDGYDIAQFVLGMVVRNRILLIFG
jgi:hypothetical protein